jgi:hypothetical protein
MARARKDIIDTPRADAYHLITRCVRRERLLDRGERKVWLCRGLANWLSHMGIGLPAYAVRGDGQSPACGDPPAARRGRWPGQRKGHTQIVTP